MDLSHFGVRKILKVFGAEVTRHALFKAEAAGNIPTPSRVATGKIKRRSWSIEDLPKIGERYGFLKKPVSPTTIAIFTAKGGVLKTTLALNIARMAALHNIKTCVVGIDMQCDITNALGFNSDIEDSQDIQSAIDRMNRVKGISNVFKNELPLSGIITSIDLPTLSFIPETPELVSLNQIISQQHRREYKLKEKIFDPLKKQFDLVVIDCSPNWNNLVNNALVACDVLISPLECKINNFRNYKAFKGFLDEFKGELSLSFKTIFVPTRFSSTRKLSMEIRSWYLANVPGCTSNAVRESIHAEEAMAMNLSLPEHVPSKLVAEEMRELLKEIWDRMAIGKREQKESKLQEATI